MTDATLATGATGVDFGAGIGAAFDTAGTAGFATGLAATGVAGLAATGFLAGAALGAGLATTGLAAAGLTGAETFTGAAAIAAGWAGASLTGAAAGVAATGLALAATLGVLRATVLVPAELALPFVTAMIDSVVSIGAAPFLRCNMPYVYSARQSVKCFCALQHGLVKRLPPRSAEPAGAHRR